MAGDLKDQLRRGKLAAQGLYDEQAIERAAEVMKRVEAEGVRLIRLFAPDPHGLLRGKTVSARVLGSAFGSGIGIPSTLLLKDTAHNNVFPVWGQDLSFGGQSLAGVNDVICAPDPDTFRVLPWSKGEAIMLCDLAFRSGRRVGISSREVLRQAERRLADAGYSAMFGLEVEFQIFEVTDPALEHADATRPARPIETRNLTRGWQYLSETLHGETEELLDHLFQMAEAFDLAPRSVEIEMGPSQFEVTFDPSGPIDQADRFTLFRSMVKKLAHDRGQHASFMAKPKMPNSAANGWHIHQSLIETATGRNVFTPKEDGALTQAASSWIAGLLENAAASCIMTNPTVNGYKRFSAYQLAPNRILWGADNRGAMIRALLFAEDQASRIENRAADSSANPYLALASQIFSGLDGLERRLDAPPAAKRAYEDEASPLPADLLSAIEAFEASPLYRRVPGEEFVAYLSAIKRPEWDRYAMAVSDWEQAEYFNMF